MGRTIPVDHWRSTAAGRSWPHAAPLAGATAPRRNRSRGLAPVNTLGVSHFSKLLVDDWLEQPMNGRRAHLSRTSC